MKTPFGIYSAGDELFFPGLIAAINSLRCHGYFGPIAIIDVGLAPWMVSHLTRFDNVRVCDIDPIRQSVRFADTQSDESPVMIGWAYKAFGIADYDLFKTWVYIDADYLPLCNLESATRSILEANLFVCTEDGENHWTHEHQKAMGVRPGTYTNINAVFLDEHANALHINRRVARSHDPKTCVGSFLRRSRCP